MLESAARASSEPVVLPRRPHRSEMRRARLRWQHACILLVCVYCGQLIVRDTISYRQVHRQYAQVEYRLATLNVQHQDLVSQVAAAQSPQFVAQQAKQDFGMVSPQEVPLAPVRPSSSVASG